MIRTAFLLALVVSFLNIGCSTTKPSSTSNDILPATALKPFGRTRTDAAQNLELITSAAHVGFRFEGAQCVVFASGSYASGHNYLQFEIDGTYGGRVKVTGDTARPITIAATGNGPHTVWIYKATEAHTGALKIHRVEGSGLVALQRPQAPLIEFIGNSITCGAAADPSLVPCGTGQYHDQHNAYLAYGPRVSRALGTNYVLSSVSGIGIYRTWNKTGPTMPQVYEKVDFQPANPERWDFSRYTPQIVSIALGTNDLSRGDGVNPRTPFDSATFVTGYIGFVQQVKSKYPAAQIALLSSPMANGTDRILLQNCLTAVKASIDAAYPQAKPVALHFFKPMQARGCTGHPNVEDHAILAAELEPFFKGLLGR
jgi:hypothetical protein